MRQQQAVTWRKHRLDGFRLRASGIPHPAMRGDAWGFGVCDTRSRANMTVSIEARLKMPADAGAITSRIAVQALCFDLVQCFACAIDFDSQYRTAPSNLGMSK